MHNCAYQLIEHARKWATNKSVQGEKKYHGQCTSEKSATQPIYTASNRGATQKTVVFKATTYVYKHFPCWCLRCCLSPLTLLIGKSYSLQWKLGSQRSPRIRKMTLDVEIITDRWRHQWTMYCTGIFWCTYVWAIFNISYHTYMFYYLFTV